MSNSGKEDIFGPDDVGQGNFTHDFQIHDVGQGNYHHHGSPTSPPVPESYGSLRPIFSHRTIASSLPRSYRRKVIDTPPKQISPVEEEYESVPEFILSYCDTLRTKMWISKALSVVLILKIALFTFLVIVSSVLYGQSYEGTPKDFNDSRQVALFAISTFVPFIIAWLIKIESDPLRNPRFHCQTFQSARAKVVSELFHYRTQTGRYHKEKEAGAAFLSKQIEQIHLSIVHELLQKYYTKIDKDSWQIKAPSSQRGMTEAATKTVAKEKFLSSLMVLTAPQHRIQHTDISSPEEDRLASLPATIPDIIEDLDREELRQLLTQYHGQPSTSAKTIDEESPVTQQQQQQQTDDKTSHLSMEQYQTVRLQNTLDTTIQSEVKWSLLNTVFSLINRLVALGASALAAFGLLWAIPILLGFSALLQTLQCLGGFENKLKAASVLIATLKELDLWWAGLSSTEQNQYENQERFVSDVEQCILSFATSS